MIPTTSPFASIAGSIPATDPSLSAAKADAWDLCPRAGFMHNKDGVIVAVNQAARRVFGDDIVGKNINEIVSPRVILRQRSVTQPPLVGSSLQLHIPRTGSLFRGESVISEAGMTIRTTDSATTAVQTLWLDERTSPEATSPDFGLRASPSAASGHSERSSPIARRRGRLYAHGIGGEINKLQGQIADLEAVSAALPVGTPKHALEATITALKGTLEDLTRNYRAFYDVHSADVGDMDVRNEAATIQEKLLRLPVSLDPRLIVECHHLLKIMRFSLDWDKIREVLTQLVHNAFKHDLSTNSVTLRISLSGLTLTFSVADKGPGFSQAFLDHVMEEREVISPHGSGGLKLTACKRLIEAMGGTFTATTKEGEGSYFSFSVLGNAVSPRLPAVSLLGATVHGGETVQIVRINRGTPRAAPIPHAADPLKDQVLTALQGSPDAEDDTEVLFAGMDLREVDSSTAPAGTVLAPAAVATPAAPAKVKAADARVLIVDDEIIARRVLERILKGLGFTKIDFAMHGEEAVTKAQASNDGYAFILMDQQMPKKTGSEAAQEIVAWQAANGKPRCPIICCSSNIGASDRAIYKAAGMDEAMIPKPASKEAVVAAVKIYVELPTP